MSIFFLCYMVVCATLSTVDAQYRIVEVPEIERSVDSKIIDIRILNSSQPPRTRKIHSNTRNYLSNQEATSASSANSPGNIIKIFSTPPPTTGGKAEKGGKYRGYKSKCRCEKIWKCHKMQISIARCPPDHFMCCS
ncbi:hypothetical protein DMENIID0001_158890 [Sergentomyia squamirostris]